MVFELYTTFIYFSNDWIFLATINYITQGEDYNMTRHYQRQEILRHLEVVQDQRRVFLYSQIYFEQLTSLMMKVTVIIVI